MISALQFNMIGRWLVTIKRSETNMNNLQLRWVLRDIREHESAFISNIHVTGLDSNCQLNRTVNFM